MLSAADSPNSKGLTHKVTPLGDERWIRSKRAWVRSLLRTAVTPADFVRVRRQIFAAMDAADPAAPNRRVRPMRAWVLSQVRSADPEGLKRLRAHCFELQSQALKWLRIVGATSTLHQLEQLERKLSKTTDHERFNRLLAQRVALLFAALRALPDWVGEWAFNEGVRESHSGERRRVAEVAATFADPESGAELHST